ncbi:MAG: sialate O-acetylesterase, partial [Oscillospiraceae bacterium]|nr:sialate O-acetylesterase [Oscillospiraceae bacterium]
MALSVSPLISDGMVIQRGRASEVCGRAKPGCGVTVGFMGEAFTGRARDDGSWRIALGVFEAGGPYSMKIEAAGDELVINDILIGDVWLCGGQSNMELPMGRVRHIYPEELCGAGNPDIRLFAVPQEYDFKAPRDGLNGGRWVCAAPETVSEFTAVGYFFAKRLYERYGVPVGLLAAAVGGTPICAWMERSALLPEDAAHIPERVGEVMREEQARSAAYYAAFDQADAGLLEGWQRPDFDDGDWPERVLDEPWDADMRRTGSIWVRRPF